MTRYNTIRYGLYPDQRLSFQDLLAHLLTYEVLSLEMLDAWSRGEKHAAIEQMQSSEESRRIHYEGIESRRNLSLAEAVALCESTQDALMRALHALDDTQWHERAPFPTPAPLDLGGALEIILVAPPRPPYRHLPVHIPDVEAYVRSLRR
jgi:hypothetical protein